MTVTRICTKIVRDARDAGIVTRIVNKDEPLRVFVPNLKRDYAY